MTKPVDSGSEDEFDLEDEYADSGDESDDFVPEPAPKRAKISATKKVAVEKKVATPRKTAAKKVIADDQEADEVETPIKNTARKTPTPKKAVPKKDVPKNNGKIDNFFSQNSNTNISSSGSTTEDVVMEEAKSATGDNEKTVEEIYQKKTQLEHILLRPDTYIGSVEAEEQDMWVFDTEQDRILKKKIKYVPGLYKIVDEILVNAADNKVRDPTMTQIKVVIDRASNFISIQNNGCGIPITEHKEEKVYVPELIFGHLLTSSNYDDNEKKITGGRNGYGAKLCNIFSTEFIVETADKERKLKYKQTFKDNMTVKGKPRITENKKGEEYTRISFKPDLSKFGMTELDADFESLIKKRVYDLAGCVEGVSVFLNGSKIPVKGFKNYCELYTKSMEFRNAEGKKAIIHDVNPNSRWQVSFAVSDGQFNQISFVNSICTGKGGTHVNYIADQIIKALLPEVQKKTNNKNIKPFQIKSHMCLFINAAIENASFDSQTKENMTSRVSSFGSTYQITEKFLNAISKSGIIDNIVKWVRFREEEQMSKADTGKMVRRLNIPKLDDANLAGVKPHNKDCTLILTEGDSAKSLVLSGLSVVGREKYGVFPLRGKLLNVRDASNTQIMNNQEITNIKAILGLKHNQTYTRVEDLRYGKLMIMTDQDHDGSHIKGLLINFIDKMFPSLLDIPGFLLEFITPIIRCTHKRSKQIINFFTIPEYEQWALIHNVDKQWQPKYFKGLGTSDKNDARDYFSKLDLHVKEFSTPDEDDRKLIDMAFNKKKVADRKEWLAGYEPGIFIDHNVNKIKISDFVNRELMLFSMADNIRSIPSMIDGFKPGQRKVFFGCIKRGSNKEIKVAQLANYVAGITQYHHGEASVAATVINMAQDFVGSNNVNLLFPAGQFGTRHEGGKSAASPRYLFTKLNEIARTIYHPDDDALLNYLVEENMSIEPTWFLPILPMVLVNGADGIGTGWSTNIPNYNPEDIVNNILRMMNDEPVVPMHPWFRGFKGEIKNCGPNKYTADGIANVTAEGHIKVTELPVRLWTDTFKDVLENMRDNKDKKPEILINNYRNNSTDSAVELTIELNADNLQKAEDIGLLKAFKIASSISTNNIVCFDKDEKIKRYNNPEEILSDFYELRLEYYVKRKEYLIMILKDEYERLDNKAKFIELVISKKLIYVNRKEEDVIEDMQKHGLKKLYPRKTTSVLAVDDDTPEDGTGYEYLFSINVRGFTIEKVHELNKQKNKKFEELEVITGTPPKTFWRRDLEVFMEKWRDLLKQDEILSQQAKPLPSGKPLKRKRVTKPKTAAAK